MCGIVGYCDLRNGIGAADQVAPIAMKMMATLRHRGPDGDGMSSDAYACLAHLRLRVIDLSEGGRQPMATTDGSLVISFNGEIYNYRALREQLSTQVAFRSTSDTEVFLQAFKAWGRDAFPRLNGMFAAAFWESAERRVVLVRDRLGKKPLFYYWDGDSRVVFASQLKALLEHPYVARTVDEESLACFLTFGYVPTPRTIFKNIYKVPQGCAVTFRAGTRTVSSYWDLPGGGETQRQESSAVDELEHLLTDATRLRLESDVPLGFFLSGGVDSTLVTAIGQKLTGNAHTFTVGFGDKRYDEAPRARAIATHLGTRHTELYLDESHFDEFIALAPKFYDEPFADSSLIATYFLSRATRDHVTVALSGDGADELFCGYEKYSNFALLARSLRMPSVARQALSKILQFTPTNTTRKVGHAIASGSHDELMRWLVSVWKPDELVRLMPTAMPRWPETQLERAWQRFAGRDHLSRLMAADVKSYLCDDILQKLDRASMAVALELRSPILDYRIVEFAGALPLDLKYRAGTSKYLLKKLLERYVPRRLWDRPKHGFNVPVAAWYRRQRYGVMSESIRELGERLEGLLSVKTMEAFLSDHVSGRYDYGQKLYALDTLNQWLKEYQ